MKNKLTACIIVKNEEDNLPICLSSIKNYCGQIVVVDTGSSDQTPIIASRFGAELYFKSWDENFSEARNFALDHARNPWILSIDADEYLENFRLDENILDNHCFGGINLKIINYLEADPRGPKSEHRYTRLFRNNPRIRFGGKIHEQIRESIEMSGYEIYDSDLNIFHTGYINTSNEKRRRNRDMLEKEAEENKDDWNTFHLAESEFSLKNNEKAKELYLNVLDSNELSLEQNDKTKIRLGQIELDLGNFEEAEKHLDFISQDTDLEGFRKFVLGAALLNEGKFADAKPLYFSDEIQNSNLIDINIVEKAKLILEQIEHK